MMDWQPGDLALCISVASEYPPQVFIGAVLTVENVWADVPGPDGELGIALDFYEADRFGDDEAYGAHRFIKVTPGADTKGIEAEKRIRVGEPA